MLLPTIPRIFIYIVPRSFGDIITGGHLVYGLSFHQITQSCWEMRMLSWNHGLGRQRLNSSIFYLGVSEKSEKYMTIQTQNLYFIRWFHDAEVRLDERRGHYSNWNWQQIMESKDFTEEEELWQSWWRLRAKVNIMVGPRTMRRGSSLGWAELIWWWADYCQLPTSTAAITCTEKIPFWGTTFIKCPNFGTQEDFNTIFRFLQFIFSPGFWVESKLRLEREGINQ